MTTRVRLAGGAACGAVWWATRHLASPSVQHWRRSALGSDRIGRLHVRHGGNGDTVTILLHGLVATGDVFGAAFDPITEAATLVVPDLLGFGRSLDEARTAFPVGDHLDALDETLTALGPSARPIRLGRHSLGAAVALRCAQRRGAQVERVVCWGAPIFADQGSFESALGGLGLMSRLFVADTSLARTACSINCAHRGLAGLIAVAGSPQLPVPIARAASLHTWPAFRDSLESFIAGTDWSEALQAARSAGTDVTLAWGAKDRIGDREYARSLGDAPIEIIDTAGHHLPLSHGDQCRAQLLGDAS